MFEATQRYEKPSDHPSTSLMLITAPFSSSLKPFIPLLRGTKFYVVFGSKPKTPQMLDVPSNLACEFLILQRG